MPLPVRSSLNLLRRFRRHRRGSAAVEFALIAPLLFGLLFAIIEVGMIFFASQVLETVTQDSARMIMTGQAQNASYTQGQFKQYVCGKISSLFDCANGIEITGCRDTSRIRDHRIPPRVRRGTPAPRRRSRSGDGERP